MEETNQSFYHEHIEHPPVPPTNLLTGQTYQQGFIYQQPIGNQNLFNAGQNPNFNQRPGFVIVSQPATTFRTHMPPQHNFNNSVSGRYYRNRRQTSSILGGLVLMLVSGLHIGWGLWRALFVGFWTSFLSVGFLTFIIMAWSLGAFVGGFVGSALTPILAKNFIYYVSAGIMIVGNLLFIIWDTDSEAIVVGRLLLGVAHGIAYVALITHAGENAAKSMRGTILSVLNCMLYTGIFVSVIITGTVQIIYISDISGERIVAIIGILLAAASLALTAMLTIESVPFLLHRNCREQAIGNLKRLRDTPNDTLELTQEIQELELMVVQDKQNSCNIFTDGNAKPLLLMIMMRLMVALTNNYLFNVLSISFISPLFDIFYLYQLRLVPLAVVGPRFFMSIFQIFYADIFNRRVQIIVSFTSAASLIILSGILWNVFPTSPFYSVENVLIAVLWMIFQFTCSIGMDQMQDVYLSEAFSTAKKSWSISFVTGIEHLFHIFMVGMYSVGVVTTVQLNVSIFVTAGMVVLFGTVLAVVLPETRNMSLKQAKDSFLNINRF